MPYAWGGVFSSRNIVYLTRYLYTKKLPAIRCFQLATMPRSSSESLAEFSDTKDLKRELVFDRNVPNLS